MTAPAWENRILFVCTANECRSPFAAAIAQRAASGLPWEFDSAGLEAWRRAVPVTGQRHAAEIGLDLSRHVSRRVHIDGLVDYDVILGLTRGHIRELLSQDPAVRQRLFTVKQFAVWIASHPPPRGRRLGDWLDSQPARPGADFLGASPDDDIADPLGRPIAAWRVMTAELSAACASIVGALSHESPRPGGSRSGPPSGRG